MIVIIMKIKNWKKKISISYNILKETDILIIEDIPINEFQNAIEILFNISSHAGYFVHTSLAFKENNWYY